MHFKQKLTYMALGGLLVLAGYILASLANDGVAQSGAQDVSFGEITCRELIVRDDEGNPSVVLNTSEYAGGHVIVFGKDGGAAQLKTNEAGGAMTIFKKDHAIALEASVADDGGGI